jgi:polysaccharide deacetylase 2 family uncharacterized protein YibQ
MKKYSFLLRFIILVSSIILCLSLIVGILHRVSTLKLKAKLETQKIIISIEDEIQKNTTHVSESNTTNAAEPVKESSNTFTPQNISNKKVLTIIITNLGLSKNMTDKALTMAPEITLGFSPYTLNLNEVLKNSISMGHENLIHVPMETKDYPQDNPGSLGLLKDLSNLENFQRFETIIGNNSCIGIYTTHDEIFTQFTNRMPPFLQYLQNHKLLYVYGGPAENQSLQQLASQTKFPLLNVDLIIDEDIAEEAIKAQLALLEKIAEKQGYALGFANPYPVTLDLLNEWLPTLEKKDIYLVPITILEKKIMDSKR